ncbi:MAG: Ig-like domain-containing protein [Micrococcales bacterium]|nr:Ig-like domain-containing protein [Micrococcales bacterium]
MPRTTRRLLLPIAAFTALTLLASGGLLSPATGTGDVADTQHGGTVPTPGAGPAAGGTTVNGMTPPEFTSIAARASSGCALDVDGNVWAWGYNSDGQLGNGTSGTGTNSSWPVRVQAAPGETVPPFAAIAEGAGTGYALDETGNVWAWGDNYYGQLGNGTGGGYGSHSSRPVQVQAAPGETVPPFTAIAAGADTGYALDETGNVWAWGRGNYGALGNGTTTNSSRPVRVQAAPGETVPPFTAIAAGADTGYALDVDGNVWAWGDNLWGQLGNGANMDSTRPVQVQAAAGALPTFTAIAAGQQTGYGLDVDGDVWAWGYNSGGQLGNGTTVRYSTRPVRVQANSGILPVFTSIGAGYATGYALDEYSNVWAWGAGSYGQLGNGTQVNSAWPVRVQAAPGETLPVFTAIAAGLYTGYALSETGGVWAWGGNQSGQLGNGTTIVGSLWPLQMQATVGSVTFGGVAGTGLSQGGGGWSVTTPAGCGPVPVKVSYGFGAVADQSADVGSFTFGQPSQFTAHPASGPLQDDGLFTARVSASGDPEPTIQWQTSTWTGHWVDIPGATGSTLSVRPPVGTQFRAAATNCWTDLDEVAYTAYSDTATATAASVSPSAPPSASPSVSGASPSPSLPPHTAKATAVALAMKKLTMKKNTTLRAVALAYPISLGAKLSWTSSNPKVAKVSPTGKIKALKPGRTVITAKAENGKLARLKVTVVAKETKVKTVKVALKGVGVRASKSEKIVVKKGKTARLSVLPNPQGATLTKMPTFKSSKPKVASVDKTGLVTANKKGKTKITIRLAGKKTTLLIHVI